MKDFIIIGAGASGLYLANELAKKNSGSILVLEKSRGVGGRMATRRTLETRFDHGAQFYRLKEDSKKIHEEWVEGQVNHLWFDSNLGHHWCAKEGMTALAKVISKKFDVQTEKQISSIEKTAEGYKLTSDKKESFEGRQVVLTAPLPQALILLDKSQITYPVELKSITYTKALIGLITLKSKLPLNPYGYLEHERGDFFSISDQEAKGISHIPALTLTMSPEFSEKYFDEADEALVLDQILNSFKGLYPEAEIKGAELKKWRYCQALKKAESMFLELSPRLYLIGDAFGGSSLLGAFRSAQALANNLN